MTDPMTSATNEWTRAFERMQEPLRWYQEQMLEIYEPMRRFSDELMEAYRPIIQYWERLLAQMGTTASGTMSDTAQIQRQFGGMFEPMRQQMDALQDRLSDTQQLQQRMQEAFAPVRSQVEQFQAQATQALAVQIEQFEQRMREAGEIQADVERSLEPMRQQMEEFQNTLEQMFERQMQRFQESVREIYEPLRAELTRVAEASADATASAATRSDNYENQTREELYELAQQRDIEGRSSMSKQELIDALRSN